MGELLSAAKSEDKRRMLVALRDKIASTIEACESGRDMAALSKRLMEVVEEIEGLDSVESPEKNPLQAAQAEFGHGG